MELVESGFSRLQCPVFRKLDMSEQVDTATFAGYFNYFILKAMRYDYHHV